MVHDAVLRFPAAASLSLSRLWMTGKRAAAGAVVAADGRSQLTWCRCQMRCIYRYAGIGIV